MDLPKADGHETSGQAEVLAFLGHPCCHGNGQPVRRIDTHAAHVFLAGPDVYKVKRAVRLPFLDYSTLELRRRACEREVEVNRGNAPDIYLGVVPITRDAAGLRIDGNGKVVEWAVHLKRFDENRTLDLRAARGELDASVIPKLATVVLDMHRRAPERTRSGAVAALRRQTEDTFDELRQQPDILDLVSVNALRSTILRLFEDLELLLRHRESAGQVRRCHGDLHLRNIVLVGDDPIAFDAIEFDDSIATCDVLYDLAFLLMDLWQRGYCAEANLLLNRYLWGSDDEALQLAGLAALPFFLALRATIRGKVSAELSCHMEADARSTAIREARSYLDAAALFVAPHPACLIGIGGLSGSGKSTLATLVSHRIGRPPGAVHLRSDVERKRLLGIGEFERASAAAYTAPVSSKTYARLRELALVTLDAGQSVIVDAVHMRAEDRDRLEVVAAAVETTFTGLWLDVPTEVTQARLAIRKRDASDATPGLTRAQAAVDVGHIAWKRLDASQPASASASVIVRLADQGSCITPAE
jgi:uncharacterized protein